MSETVVSWDAKDGRHTIMVTGNGTIYHWDARGLVAEIPGKVWEDAE